LLGVKAAEEQLKLAKRFLRPQLQRSPNRAFFERAIYERLAQDRGRTGRLPSAAFGRRCADLQDKLRQHLGTNVAIHHGPKRGRIEN